MNPVWWMQAMAITTALGHSEGAGGAESLGPIVVAGGTGAIVTLCLVGGVVWGFVAWTLGWRLKDAIRRGKTGDTGKLLRPQISRTTRGGQGRVKEERKKAQRGKPVLGERRAGEDI